jgi:hypothetical protein
MMDITVADEIPFLAYTTTAFGIMTTLVTKKILGLQTSLQASPS